jgi:hypothetical protein
MPTVPQSPNYPLLPPTVSGRTVTVDWLFGDVKRVNRALANILLQKFIVDVIFAPAGDVSSGAVIYDQLVGNDLYPDRDVQRIEPGGTHPVLTFSGPTPLTAQSEKFGGKFPVLDEARRRNRLGQVTRALRQVSNVIARKTQQRALTELSAAVTAHARTAVGTSWLDAAALLEANRAPNVLPIADLTMVEQQNEVQELGYEYNTAIMNPVDWRYFRLAAGGDAGSARQLLRDSGITNLWITNRKVAGTVYWLAAQQVGELGFERGLFTETWRDADHEQDWYKTNILPIVYVTDPFAILETTGHQA